MVLPSRKCFNCIYSISHDTSEGLDLKLILNYGISTLWNDGQKNFRIDNFRGDRANMGGNQKPFGISLIYLIYLSLFYYSAEELGKKLYISEDFIKFKWW